VRAASGVLAVGLAMLWACGGEGAQPSVGATAPRPPGEGPVAPSLSSAADAPSAPAGAVQFSVRGRWDDPSRLRYRLEMARVPVDGAVWRRAVERALGAWEATGVVGFEEAGDDELADVVLSWHRGHHGACLPFGVSPAVAHSGPVGPGSFVHFDIERTWSEDGDEGHSLFYTALHELGHVLGLGHSSASDALMQPEPRAPARLSASEWAGLQSLYGGGVDRPGDLLIRRSDGAQLAALRQVAPRGLSEFAVFDSDGDGDDEVLVWRTDPAGAGMLMVYDFAAGPRLVATVGPLYGMASAGASHWLARGGNGTRYFVVEYEDGHRLLRRFDENSLLLPVAEPEGELVRWAPEPQAFDLDGDGTVERIEPAR